MNLKQAFTGKALKQKAYTAGAILGGTALIAGLAGVIGGSLHNEFTNASVNTLPAWGMFVTGGATMLKSLDLYKKTAFGHSKNQPPPAP